MVAVKLEPEEVPPATFSNDAVKLESSDIKRPRKKQRVIDEVNVLDASVPQIRQEESDSEESKFMKLKEIFNIKEETKQKKNKKETEPIIDLRVMLRRLEPIGALVDHEIDLSRAEINQMVSRLFMSSIYGGSMQATFPSIGKEKLEKHGMNDFMYLHLKYHPFAPQNPGRCGLWFSTEDEKPETWAGLKRVFTRDREVSMWQYMGQYDVQRAASLTLEEWLDHKPMVRNAWAKEICRKPWGSDVCARIQAHKAVGPQRKPMKKVKDSEKKTTVQEVRDAFDRGIERLGVWTLKCV